ncbi:hypothetical protein BDP27DRAFT_1347286 [Rhodocollybia butyracea]|uniref:SAP domain-containing protein n=1 Tax=Rhodocollybia butyracea TaxID=206335 RepID=A0A9P5TW30_9AGAR|nr:hypothetical protein BDP27DRAFT_1347286 [Rhodocollybia butyracea]
MAVHLTIPADPKDEDFPFPNGESIKLRKKTLNELKELLQSFKLKVSGNKAAVLQRLIDYSGDPSAWNNIIAGRRQPHKGPRDSKKDVKPGAAETKPKKKSQVNARRDELMGEPSPKEPTRAVLRSKDNRTQQQKDEVPSWADRFAANNPDMETPRQLKELSDTKGPLKHKLDSRLASIEDQLQVLISEVKGSPNDHAMEVSTQSQSVPLPSPTPGSVSNHAPSLSSPFPTSNLTSLSLPMAPPPASQDVIMDTIRYPRPNLTPNLITMSPQPTCALPLPMKPLPLPSLPATDIEMMYTPVTESTKLLVLGNGTCLQFLSSDIPDPLCMSFVKDIPKLGRVWDDSQAEFSPSECTLKIKGHAIALKHWPIAYSYSHDRRWHGIKKVWDTWKWVAERYNQSTPENFWTEFYDSEHNQRMTYTAIKKVLRKQRIAANQCLVRQQQEQLGLEFSQQYQVRGKPMVRFSAIAKRVQKVKQI